MRDHRLRNYTGALLILLGAAIGGMIGHYYNQPRNVQSVQNINRNELEGRVNLWYGAVSGVLAGASITYAFLDNYRNNTRPRLRRVKQDEDEL